MVKGIRAGVGALLGLAFVIASSAAAKDRPPFVWPGGPGPQALAEAKATKSASGLVLIDRTCSVSVRTFDAEPYGVIRDDFLRFLVTGEQGVKKASVEVSDNPSAHVTVVEGRTVAPDGTITLLDESHDVHKVEFSTLSRKRTVTSLATVKFPTPQIGAILDLHFVTESDDLMFAVTEPMAFEDIPLLASQFRLKIMGGIPLTSWSVVTVGQGGRAQIGQDPMIPGTIVARIESYSPPRREPLSPPSYHEQMTLLAFINLSGLHGMGLDANAAFHSTVEIDSRGRIGGTVFDSPQAAKYWIEVLKESAKSDKAFLKHEGDADAINVATAAPATMPLEQRLAALYRLTQDKLTYKPDVEGVDTLRAMLKKGMSDSNQGTLLFAYLLDRAAIPYRVALVCDRYRLRFLPTVHNEYLYDFATAVVVQSSDGKPLAFMPGELTLPYGALPDAYQESLALLPKGDDAVETLLTPADAAGVDSIAYRYDLTLDAEGDVTGKARHEQRGAPAWELGHWLLSEQYAAAHPSKDDKKRGATAEKERKQKLSDALEGEFTLPGDRLKLDDVALVRTPQAAQDMLELSAGVRGKGIAQRVGDQWVVDVYPLMAGWTSRFVADTRRTAIWYPKAGHVVVEGDLRLPAGARVAELPRPWELAGPGGTTSRGSVEARDEGGTTILHGRFEFDQPVSVAVELYPQWKAFQANLARVAGDGALVSMPAAKVLE